MRIYCHCETPVGKKWALPLHAMDQKVYLIVSDPLYSEVCRSEEQQAKNLMCLMQLSDGFII